MAQSSNGVEVPEKTNGGSIPGCDDEIGGGVLEQVFEMEIKGRVFLLKGVLEMFERKCQDYNHGAAGSDEDGNSLARHFFSGKGWESKENLMLMSRSLTGDFKPLSLLDGGAARGSEGGFAHLTQCEVDELEQFLTVGARFAAWQNKPLVSSSHDLLISSLSKGCEGDEFERWINVMLNGAAARGRKLDQPEVDKLARQINKILDTLSEGGTAHLAGTSRPGNRATEQSHREPKNGLLCQDAAGGNKAGEMDIKGRVFPLKEVLEMIERKCQDYDQGAAGSGEGGISYFRNVFSGKGWELKELRMLINRCLNGDFKTFSQVYDHVFLIKIILDGGAARGGFAHLTQCEVDTVMLQTNALLDLIGNSRNFAGRQSNPLISSLSKGCEADKFEQAICKGGVPHMAGKQIKSTRDGESDTAHSPPGFAPAGKSRARSIDSKDEKPKSTDLRFRKLNNFLECVVALFLSLCVTVMLPPKCFLRIILGLLAISLTCHFAVIVFSKKLPSKIANLALSLAITCNGCSFLLMAGFFLAKL